MRFALFLFAAHCPEAKPVTKLIQPSALLWQSTTEEYVYILYDCVFTIEPSIYTQDIQWMITMSGVYFLPQPVLFAFCAGNELFFAMLYLVYYTPGPTGKHALHTCTHGLRHTPLL